MYLETTLEPEEPALVPDSTTAAFAALRAGRVEAVMSDVPIVVDAAGRYPGPGGRRPGSCRR
jgi:ABC-type amino acid transport substrate-binding protein